jgi:hypothetical protein
MRQALDLARAGVGMVSPNPASFKASFQDPKYFIYVGAEGHFISSKSGTLFNSFCFSCILLINTCSVYF